MERRTFSKVLDTDVVELLDLLHDQVFLVNLDDDGGMARVSTREAELAQGILELLGNVYSARLRGWHRVGGFDRMRCIENTAEKAFRTAVGEEEVEIDKP